MKITIIGAGNMGGAIARGLARGSRVAAADITVADPDPGKLDSIKASNPHIHTATSNREAAAGAGIILIAVKPWLVKEVITALDINPAKQIIASVAAGIPFSEYTAWITPQPATLFRIVPNTAISQQESMTLVASHNATREQEQLIISLFEEMGPTMLIPEKQIPATTALASCGIAYVLKYIQAAMQAGIEMGIAPKDAAKIVAQSAKGAAALILKGDTHPAVEIDKVTTPGGITIKGINELEHAGFTSAVIRALKEAGKG
ncbi:MAG: pyrroline-5-carboxylate reductase [Mediterranea sp.]|jgi:pyrroline-5-carboxylate reductase|nr:pyrroline-5-carboxylate reductase [Mediterranea sp.]